MTKHDMSNIQDPQLFCKSDSLTLIAFCLAHDLKPARSVKTGGRTFCFFSDPEKFLALKKLYGLETPNVNADKFFRAISVVRDITKTGQLPDWESVIL